MCVLRESSEAQVDICAGVLERQVSVEEAVGRLKSV